MKKIFILSYSLFFISYSLFSQDVYPTHWWVGMKNPKVQLMVHSANIKSGYRVFLKKYPGVKITGSHTFESPNYITVDMEIDKTAKPGNLHLTFMSVDMQISQLIYELKPRSIGNGKTRVKGVTSEDLIYLLMPDRFSNGDPSNDFFADMRDTDHDRNNPFDRHGGDLLGVQNHLDYLKDLGVTAIWMTPVVENDMSRTIENGSSRSTYHGYAFTNQYKIDKRLGGDVAYKNLIIEAHKKGIKIIQDAVYNHIGNDHWLFHDLPAKDWLNQWPEYQNTSHRNSTILDPGASSIDKKITLDGWFTPFLADLNQRNPYVSNFLIQYAVWATEENGIDGWRVDTYFYNDEVFLNKINDVLLKEFSKISVFGEVAVNNPVSTAYFSENNLSVSFKHNCPGVTDFPVMFSIHNALNQSSDWDQGINNLYLTLTADLLYKNPMHNCTSLDNHDQNRFFSVVGEDFNKYKMGIALLFTLRGIPQLYYGTEILMKNLKVPTDAEVRKDFPGGWSGDPENKFEATGRTDKENEAFNYVKELANFRKNSSAIKTGKMMQFVPRDSIYVYFRYDEKQTVMCVVNTTRNEKGIDFTNYSERTNGFNVVTNAVTGNRINLNSKIPPMTMWVLDLSKGNVTLPGSQ